MSTIVIGLTGAAGAGKDTVADRLVLRLRQAGHSSERIALADPIRRMLGVLGVPACYMTDRSLKELPVPGFGRSYRHLAQTLGTEWGRGHVKDELWLDLAARRIADEARAVEPGHFIAIVPDVRFPNEARWLRRQGGMLLRVDRPGVAPVRGHSSENHYAHMAADIDLRNNGSLQDLLLHVDFLAGGIFTWAHQRRSADAGAPTTTEG